MSGKNKLPSKIARIVEVRGNFLYIARSKPDGGHFPLIRATANMNICVGDNIETGSDTMVFIRFFLGGEVILPAIPGGVSITVTGVHSIDNSRTTQSGMRAWAQADENWRRTLRAGRYCGGMRG